MARILAQFGPDGIEKAVTESVHKRPLAEWTMTLPGAR
jgi:hypothetical protein